MVVETSLLQPFLISRWIREDVDPLLDLIAAKHFFVARQDAEISPQWRQIIPYVIIGHGDQYFVLTRTTRQAEARLHHKKSLGIGGHINPGHTLRSGLQKELDEEVQIDAPYELQFAGFINDDATEVGRVHFGAAYMLAAADNRVQVKETDKMSGQWMPRPQLSTIRNEMESWSQIVYDALLS